MSKVTGGPAFPEIGNVGFNSDWQNESGMTLRDYFAAKAMQGMLSNSEWNHWSTEQHAEYAYGVADAMLKAREES